MGVGYAVGIGIGSLCGERSLSVNYSIISFYRRYAGTGTVHSNRFQSSYSNLSPNPMLIVPDRRGMRALFGGIPES